MYIYGSTLFLQGYFLNSRHLNTIGNGALCVNGCLCVPFGIIFRVVTPRIISSTSDARLRNVDFLGVPWGVFFNF